MNNYVVSIWGLDLYVKDLEKYKDALTPDKEKAKAMTREEAQEVARAVDGRVVRK